MNYTNIEESFSPNFMNGDEITIEGFVEENHGLTKVGNVSIDFFITMLDGTKNIVAEDILTDSNGDFKVTIPLSNLDVGRYFVTAEPSGLGYQKQLESKMQVFEFFIIPSTEVKLTISPNMIKSGGKLIIHASLPSYDKPDEERYAIDILDPDGVQVDSTLWAARQDFEYEFKTASPAYGILSGKYQVVAEKAHIMERTGVIISTTWFEISNEIIAPLKQNKNGIENNVISCKNELSLVIKKSNGMPACVKSKTVQKLIERGWALK